MSNSILVSLQNISSSLKSVTNVVKADNFYDTIYCGKYYDRFSVRYNAVESYLYVIKQKNDQMERFMSSVDVVSLYHDSPFAISNIYRDELLCYEGKDAGVYYDIAIIENVGSLSLAQFMLKNRSIYSVANTVEVVKSFTSSLLWIIHYGIHIDGFCGKNVVVCDRAVKLRISERMRIITTQTQIEQIEYCKKLIFALVASWILLLRADKSYKIADEMLDYLESYNKVGIHSHIFEIAGEIDSALGSDICYVVNYLIEGKGELSSCVESIRELLSIENDKIEQLCVGVQNPSSYHNNDSYDLSYGTSENRAIVRNKKNGKFGYISSYGEAVVDCIYDEVTHFSEGIAVVGIDKKYFAINSNGDLLTHERYDAIQWYSDVNRFIVHKDGVYSLLNRAGEVMSKRGYGWIGEFSFNRSVVESVDDGRKGYIDLDGVEITPIIYDDALSFENGIGKVLFEGVWRTVIYDGDVV